MRSASRFFYFLAGTSETVIRDCPEAERNYHAAIGGFVLVTAIAASLSGGYALYTVFHSIPAAVLFGLFWGLAIGAVDRFIVMTMDLTAYESRARMLLAAGSRLVLASFVAFVIARPLELRIFEPEIAGYLQGGVARRLDATVQAVERDLEQKQAQHEINGRLAEEKGRAAALGSELVTCRADEIALREATHGECDGTAGTRRVGLGPICELKRADLEAVKARCGDLESRRTTSEALVVQLTDEQTRIMAELRASAEASIQAAQREAAADMARIAAGETGSLLTRLDALNALASQSSSMFWTMAFVTLLFVVVEALPVGLKLLVAGRGNYPVRVMSDEIEFAKRHRIERRFRERERMRHRTALHELTEAVREQQRTKVLRTVARGEDLVVDEVNTEIRYRTEVASKDVAEPRTFLPPQPSEGAREELDPEAPGNVRRLG